MLPGYSLSDYKLTDGSKLNLVIKRRENSDHSPSTSAVKDCNNTVDFKAISANHSSTAQQTLSDKSNAVGRTNQGAKNYCIDGELKCQV